MSLATRWRGSQLRIEGERILVVAILLLSLLLRTGWPRLTEFKFSEARLEALALDLTRNGRLPLVGVPSSAGFDHSPLSVYLYVPPFLLTTDPVLATVYGGLINAVAVWLAWRLARRWPGGGRVAGLAAVLLFAVSPWSVVFSRKIWQIAFVPLLALVFVGMLASALVLGRRWALAPGILLYAMLVQVHPSALSLLPALCLWLVLYWRNVGLRPLLAGMGLSILSLVPFAVHQVRSGWPVFSAAKALPSARWDLNGIRLAWDAATGSGIDALAGQSHLLLEWVPQLTRSFAFVGYLAIASILFLMCRMLADWRKHEAGRRMGARLDLILVSWLVIPTAFNLRQNLELHLHFYAVVLPAVFLIVGRAAQGVVSGNRRRTLGLLFGAALGLVAVTQVTALALLGRFVATHPTAGGFGTPLGDYQAVADEAVELARQEKVGEVLVIGEGVSPIVSEQPAIFDVLLRGRVMTRFVDGRTTAVFPAQHALLLIAPDAGEGAEWYSGWPTRELTLGYKGVILDGAWPVAGFEPVTDAGLFQNGVQLQGFAWRSGDDEGGGCRFWLLWQVLWMSETDTHFSLQILDSDGRFLVQQDVPGYPLLGRRKGDRIVSRFDITPPGGSLTGSETALVGQYEFPAIVSVAVIDQAGNPVGQTVGVNLPDMGW